MAKGDAYYLVDGVEPSRQAAIKPILAIVAHSPNAAKYKHFTRQIEGVQEYALFMPPWEWEEMQELHKKLFPNLSPEEVALADQLLVAC